MYVDLMALLICIVLNIQMFHGILIILLIIYQSSIYFSFILQIHGYYFDYYICLRTDFLWSNKLTVYTNVQVIFPVF